VGTVRLEGIWKVYEGSRGSGAPKRVREPGLLAKKFTVRGAIDAVLAIQAARSARSEDVTALKNVSLSVRENSIYVIMGLSGSGKSTLLRCINMLAHPTKGKVFLDDEDLTSASEERLREIRGPRIAMVFQHHALLPHRTVNSNVAFGLELEGMPAEERIDLANEALKLVQLDGWGDRYPHELSGGMQQRVGLARALTTDADVLLLDEPFSGLDPLTRRQMQLHLLDLQKRLRRTMIFVTHDISEAVILGDKVMILENGVVAQEGSPLEIVFQPATDYVKDFVAEMDKHTLLSVGALIDFGCRTECSLAGHQHDTELEQQAAANRGNPDGHVVCTGKLRSLVQMVSASSGSVDVLHACGCVAQSAVDARQVVEALAAPELWNDNSAAVVVPNLGSV
jgi:ABC-type proline/glycine betaine transport system ATPase subunit